MVSSPERPIYGIEIARPGRTLLRVMRRMIYRLGLGCVLAFVGASVLCPVCPAQIANGLGGASGLAPGGAGGAGAGGTGVFNGPGILYVTVPAPKLYPQIIARDFFFGGAANFGGAGVVNPLPNRRANPIPGFVRRPVMPKPRLAIPPQALARALASSTQRVGSAPRQR